MRCLHRGLTVLFLAACLGGCAAGASGGGEGTFEVVSLEGAPVQVQRTYDRMKGAAGLYVVPAGQETFLLLCAAKPVAARMAVEVLEVTWIAGAKEARVLATLQDSPQAGEYPCTAVKVEGGRGVEFRARLNLRDEGVVELEGMRIEEAVPL